MTKEEKTGSAEQIDSRPTLISRVTTLIPHPITQALLISIVITSATYVIAIAAGWLKPGELNYFEILAGGLNYIATYLCIKQKRIYALIGIFGSGVWSYVFWTNGLLASSVVNAYLAILLIYGYWRWGKDTNPRPPRHLKVKWVPAYLIFTTLFYLGAVYITNKLGGEFAFWDAAILVLTILAQLLQDQKVITVWFVWGLVNIVGVILYFNSGLYFAVIQQAIFGLANILGYREWKRDLVND